MPPVIDQHREELTALCRRSGARRLDALNASAALSDLRVPPGNRLEALRGNQKGRYSIRVNDQFRVTFRFEGGHAWEVRCEDYH